MERRYIAIDADTALNNNVTNSTEAPGSPRGWNKMSCDILCIRRFVGCRLNHMHVSLKILGGTMGFDILLNVSIFVYNENDPVKIVLNLMD